MKFPNNIFGEMLRKELEASGKLSEHFKKGYSKGKSATDENKKQLPEDKILGAEVVDVHMSEFSRQYENEPCKPSGLSDKQLQILRRMSDSALSKEDRAFLREQEAFNFYPYEYIAGVVEEERRKAHAKKISKMLGWDDD
jgi:hypothetical protein